MESPPFRKLIVWQKAMDLVRMVYRKSKDFPVDERYALTDQLRRAVVSIPSNIAEGSGRA
jgi:four helix bundle protein